MAKNKRDIDRQLKQDEIEEAACQLFLRQGYDATSMASIATSAGVAPNTLYWYFANKDEVLIAVLNRLVKQALTVHAGLHDQPMSAQILWLLKEFDQASKLVMTVHGRLEHSPVIRAWHEQFHQMLDGLLIAQLTAQGMAPEQASVMATVGTYVVEGLLSHPHSLQERETVVTWLTGAGSRPAVNA
ncbi:TetR/AcrR family transcriptional regulator [Aquabacterium sp.]|uniref:TetR/AcrR family transcriptional regulator n=1 Tax=Aquabacterium sp. TaxID=1872578 RepID=UPI003D6D77DD